MASQDASQAQNARDLACAHGAAFVRLDDQERIVDLSPQAEALFGVPRGQALGQPVSALAGGGQDQRLAVLARRARERGTLQHLHLDAQAPGGEPLFLSVLAGWTEGGAEGGGSAVLLATDIAAEREDYEKLKRNTLEIIQLNAEIRRQSDARQQALDALAELSARLQGVLTAAAQVVIVATGPTGRVTVVSSGACNLLGFAEKELVDKATPLAFLDPDEVAARGRALARQGRPGPEGLSVLAELAESGPGTSGEWTLVRKDGSRFPAEVVLSPIRGAEGVEGFLLVGVDISARRQAEEGLREHAARLEEQRRAMEHDLKAAADIQRGLLPSGLSPDARWDAHWLFEPSATVGGDIFNILALSDDHLAVYILDVSGHGVSSALVASAAAQALRGLARQGLSPEALLAALDREFPLERFDRYFSMVYLVLDLGDGAFTYCNAGHPPPLLTRAGGRVEALETGGTVVGLGDIMPFERGAGRLGRGDLLLFYTDGVTEFENAAGEPFGTARLRSWCAASAGSAPAAFLDGLGREVAAFGQGAKPQDDLSALALRLR